MTRDMKTQRFFHVRGFGNELEASDRVFTVRVAAAHAQGCSARRLPSGAGHDAQMFARVCPTAMVFVPSVHGISHNVTEYTEPTDIEAGANVLLQTLLALTGTRF